MKQKNVLIIFVVTHLLFVFLQIHKQSYIVRLTFENQRLEKQKKDLLTKKNNLEQYFSTLQDRNQIKQFAQNQLGMQKIKLNQIKQLPADVE